MSFPQIACPLSRGKETSKFWNRKLYKHLKPFNLQQIQDYLSHWGQAEIPLIYGFETVTSTNQRLWELLDEGKSPPLVAIATQQTAGRGQWGRTWHSPPGGLYVSIALKFNLTTLHGAHLTLLSAWGIANELQRYHLPVKLKWPNDLILQGKKLGGIKSEIRSQGGMISQAIIGIGLNWRNPVPKTGINLQSFGENQTNPSITSLEELAALVLNGVLKGYQYYHSQGIEALLRRYLAMLDSVGRTVMIEGMSGMITGVTAQGELTVCLKASGAKTEINLPPGSISLGYEA